MKFTVLIIYQYTIKKHKSLMEKSKLIYNKMLYIQSVHFRHDCVSCHNETGKCSLLQASSLWMLPINMQIDSFCCIAASKTRETQGHWWCDCEKWRTTLGKVPNKAKYHLSSISTVVAILKKSACTKTIHKNTDFPRLGYL